MTEGRRNDGKKVYRKKNSSKKAGEVEQYRSTVLKEGRKEEKEKKNRDCLGKQGKRWKKKIT